MLRSPDASVRRQLSLPVRLLIGTWLLVLVAGASGMVGYYLAGNRQTAQNKADLTTFWRAWGIIDAKFYGDTAVDKRLDGAINGMVAGLGDPYTVYLAPKQDKAFRQDLQGEFGGIGAELTVKNGLLTVVSALEGTPSEKADLKPNDIIQKIDGTATADINFADAVDAIRGEKGSTLVLTIVREGKEAPFDVTLTRDTIVVKSVSTDVLGPNKDIGYVKVNQFGQDTAEAFAAALRDVGTNQRKGVIIDLRNNPGGYLTVAMQMIGAVLPRKTDYTDDVLNKRVGVLERGKAGEEQLKVTGDVVLEQTPIVVLVNEGSASASEIFSGAMKDYKRAVVVGTKTYGKGSVQELQELGNGGSIKVTVAKWFTPLGIGIDKEGVMPDVEVALPADTTASKDDAQVRAAIDVLTKSSQ